MSIELLEFHQLSWARFSFFSDSRSWASQTCTIRIASIVVALSIQLASISVAQGRDSVAMPTRRPMIDLNDGVTFEISPHTAIMGKSGAFGLRLSMNYGTFNLELAGEQVLGTLANLYPLSVNGVLNLATRSRLIPYGVVGVGLLLTVPTATIGDETVSSLGVNFGVGARYYFTKSFGIRAEVKEYITNIKNSKDAKSELLLFQEVSVGVTFMVR